MQCTVEEIDQTSYQVPSLKISPVEAEGPLRSIAIITKLGEAAVHGRRTPLKKAKSNAPQKFNRP